MKAVAVPLIKGQFSKFLRLAEKGEIVIMRHGKPAGVLVGFKSEDDRFDYRTEPSEGLTTFGFCGRGFQPRSSRLESRSHK
jgi:prevent-host-death family protein